MAVAGGEERKGLTTAGKVSGGQNSAAAEACSACFFLC